MKKITTPPTDFKENLTYQIEFTANFNKAFRRKFHKIHMGEKASADEFFLLVLLNSEPDISQIKMSKLLFKGKAHVGKILNEMSLKGLIERELKDDGSATVNKITEKGFKVLEEGLHKIKSIIISHMEKEFTRNELDSFVSFLKRYRKVLGSIVDVKLK